DHGITLHELEFELRRAALELRNLDPEFGGRRGARCLGRICTGTKRQDRNDGKSTVHSYLSQRMKGRALRQIMQSPGAASQASRRFGVPRRGTRSAGWRVYSTREKMLIGGGRSEERRWKKCWRL